ncbi:MAG: metal-sulfur cluster assembly factor [Nanoarchaeota archaeon]
MVSKKFSKQDAISVLKKVIDPEIGLDIYNLELIYGVNVSGDSVNIKMTLTSPTCPYGPMILREVKEKLQKKGFKNPTVDVVFEPAWKPSDKVKMLLGLQ